MNTFGLKYWITKDFPHNFIKMGIQKLQIPTTFYEMFKEIMNLLI